MCERHKFEIQASKINVIKSTRPNLGGAFVDVNAIRHKDKLEFG